MAKAVKTMITVVIPTVGRNQTFGRAFDSAIRADQRLVSSIVVVDNSQSPQFRSNLNELITIANDSRVIVISQPERVSMAKSWNSSLNTVRTAWVLFLHDDDELLNVNSLIDSILPILDKSLNYGFLAFEFQCHYYSRIFRTNRRVTRRWLKPISATSLLDECPKLVSTIINVEQLRKIQGFSDEYGNFLDLIAFLEIYKAFNAVFVPITLGVYYLHEGNESDISKRATGYGNYIPNACKRVFDLYEDDQVRSKFIKTILGFVYPQQQTRASNIITRLFGI